MTNPPNCVALSTMPLIDLAQIWADECNVRLSVILAELARGIDRNSLPDALRGMKLKKGQLPVRCAWGYTEASYLAIEELSDGFPVSDARLELIYPFQVKREDFREWCIANSKPLPRFWFSTEEHRDGLEARRSEALSIRNKKNQSSRRGDALRVLLRKTYQHLLEANSGEPDYMDVINSLIECDDKDSEGEPKTIEEIDYDREFVRWLHPTKGSAKPVTFAAIEKRLKRITGSMQS